MNELLVIRCAACKSEKRFVLPLAGDSQGRWVCACEAADRVSARFFGLNAEGVVPEKFRALDALLRKVLTRMAPESEQRIA